MDISLIFLSAASLIIFIVGITLCVKSKYWSKKPEVEIYNPPSLLETLANKTDRDLTATTSRQYNRSGTSKFSEQYCNVSTFDMVKSPLRKSISEGDLLNWDEDKSSSGSSESLEERGIGKQIHFIRRIPPPAHNLVTRSCEMLSAPGLYEYVEADIHMPPKRSTKRKFRASRPLPNLPNERSRRSAGLSMSYSDIPPFVNVTQQSSCRLTSSAVTDIHQSVPLPPFIGDDISRSCIDLRMTIHPSRVSIHARIVPNQSIESVLKSPSESTMLDQVQRHHIAQTAATPEDNYEIQHSYDYDSVEYVRSLMPYAIDPHNDYF